MITRMNRKRSHDDIEDADECLPISKRINSLHLEGKVQGICHNQHHHLNGLLNNNINPEMIISPLTPAGGSSLPFPNHLQQGNGRLAHQLNTIGDKSQTFPSIQTDYNCNIPSSSNMNGLPAPSHPHSHHHHHLPPQNIYHGASNVMMSSDPAMLNINGAAHQSFHCNDNHNHHHHHHHSLCLDTDRQQTHPSLPSFYQSQSATPFVNNQIPMSSSTNVRLVNSHYSTTATNISCDPIAAGTTATNLIHGHPHLSLQEDLPTEPYNPELGMAENPHYYDTNKLLYEAHLSRLQRVVPDHRSHL